MLIQFTVRQQEAELWCSIFQSLEDGMADASLQDKMEIFGRAVDGKLEKLIDDYGVERAFRVEFWNQDGLEFNVMILTSTQKHKEFLLELLALCPITNLTIKKSGDW